MKYVKGNLIDAPETIIIHGCNMQGVMGSGVAKAIRDKWPEAYKSYRDFINSGEAKLGDCCVGHIKSISCPICGSEVQKWIANGLTQVYYGNDGKVYAKPSAIRSVLVRVKMFYPPKLYTYAMPKIGCGFGGLDWETQVEPIVEECLPEAVIYEL